MNTAESAGIEVMSAKERTIRASDLKPLFDHAEWTRTRDERSIAAMLSGTSVNVGAWRAGHLIGYARAVSDGVFRAFIEDIIVSSSHRGIGLGSRLMDALIAELEGIQEVKLSCVPDLVPFYGRFGFVEAGLVGMEQRSEPSRR